MLFELRDVSLQRDGKAVLRSLDASIPEGVSALAGPSGSGKSTVLRLLNRLSDPQTGAVAYRGADVRERDPLRLRREVCLVPQLPALIDGTVADNVRYAAQLGGEAGEPDIARLLRLAGLDESFAERDGGKLSVGEQQRSMLARALAVEPRVLLLDEPTSALDEDARDAIEATLGDLHGELGVDIVLVTHDLDQARRLAGWVVRVEAGSAIAAGPADRVLT